MARVRTVRNVRIAVLVGGYVRQRKSFAEKFRRGNAHFYPAVGPYS